MTNVHARFYLALLTAGAVCFLAGKSGAATELQPGLWQETETGEENGQKKIETTTRCMTADEAKEPAKAVVFDEDLRKNCKALSYKRIGDKMTFRLECGAELFNVAMDADFTIDTPQHYHGAVKASLSLGPIAMGLDKTIDAKRIGDCSAR